MPAAEEAILYRVCIAYIAKNQGIIESKWHEYIQFVVSGLITGSVEDKEVTLWFWNTHVQPKADPALYTFLRGQGIDPTKPIRHGYMELTGDVAAQHIRSILRIMFYHWKNRYFYQASMIELSNAELLEYMENGSTWWQQKRFAPKPDQLRQVEWFKRARSLFFSRYSDELEIAKDTNWYDWCVSEDAVKLYIQTAYETMNPYAWLWTKLAELMADGWPSGENNYEEAS